MTPSPVRPCSSDPAVRSAVARALDTRRRVLRARLLAPDCGAAEVLALCDGLAALERERASSVARPTER
ncbi:MAG: hypothetical protein R3E88_10360 [Myxococcota bacterium]